MPPEPVRGLAVTLPPNHPQGAFDSREPPDPNGIGNSATAATTAEDRARRYPHEVPHPVRPGPGPGTPYWLGRRELGEQEKAEFGSSAVALVPHYEGYGWPLRNSTPLAEPDTDIVHVPSPLPLPYGSGRGSAAASALLSEMSQLSAGAASSVGSPVSDGGAADFVLVDSPPMLTPDSQSPNASAEASPIAAATADAPVPASPDARHAAAMATPAATPPTRQPSGILVTPGRSRRAEIGRVNKIVQIRAAGDDPSGGALDAPALAVARMREKHARARAAAGPKGSPPHLPPPTVPMGPPGPPGPPPGTAMHGGHEPGWRSHSSRLRVPRVISEDRGSRSSSPGRGAVAREWSDDSSVRIPYPVQVDADGRPTTRQVVWVRGHDVAASPLLGGLPPVPTFPHRGLVVDEVRTDRWGRPECSARAAAAAILLAAAFPPAWLLLGSGYFDSTLGVVPRRAKQAALALGVLSLVAVALVVGLLTGLA